MRIDRLIGILSILIQKENITAPELAERFEVSRRTINRDIEELCMAGIPICTRQGVNGGISIMDNYKMDHTLLTTKEMQEILTGLRSLDSISGNNQYEQLMEKLKIGSSDFMSGSQSILINLSSYDKGTLAEKISSLRAAIDSCFYINFLYYSPKGETRRRIEPYYLIFQWGNWYVWGWCTEREDFRMFKLKRMNLITMESTHFEKRAVQMPDLTAEMVFPDQNQVEIIFEEECKWRLVEEYGPECYTVCEDGRLLFRKNYTNKEFFLSWLLAFGSQAEVIKPQAIREEITQIAENLVKIYKDKEM